VTLPELHERAAAGNPEARDWLGLWGDYCHEIDDLIDNRVQSTEIWIKLLIHANVLYSANFYNRHARELELVVATITSAYADSVKWEGEKCDWKRQWSDTLRFAGSEMVLAVASICGGFELVRELSPLLREINWTVQHESTLANIMKKD